MATRTVAGALPRAGHSRALTLFVLSSALFTTCTGTAHAGVVTSPAGGRVQVAINSARVPVPFTITASGFPPGDGSVYVEQCDGVPAPDPSWSATRDCDTATSPAAASVGSDGVASFPANDPNFGFSPFAGKSPQGLFNCVAPGDTLQNGKHTFANCQIRVATRLTAATTDQAFATLVFPPGASGMAQATTPTTGPQALSSAHEHASSSNSSKTNVRVARSGSRAAVAAVAAPATKHDAHSDDSIARKLRKSVTSLPGLLLIGVWCWLAFDALRRHRMTRRRVA